MPSGIPIKIDPKHFCDIYSQNKSIKYMAKYFDLSVDGIRAFMRKHNIKIKYKSIYSCNDSFFENESEESFYWAGFIAADGSIYKRKNTHVLKISLATIDVNHIEKFRLALNSNHPIKHYYHKSNNPKWNDTTNSEIAICSQKLCKSLESKFLITERKSLTLQFPDIQPDNVRHFCRGYVDGDGSFSVNKANNALQFSAKGTYDFLFKLHAVIDKNINEVKNRKISLTNGIYHIGYSGNKIVSKIGKWLYEDSKIYLDRKKNYFFPV